MSELSINEVKLYEKIEELQRTIENFVTDIGYDLEKFLNYSPSQKRKKPSPPSLDPKVESKISELYESNSVSSGDFTAAFNLLPSAAKLELYTFLVENSSDLPNQLNLADLQEFDPEEKMKKKQEARAKSKLELIKLQRDSKRRRQKFKGGKVHAGCRTIMEKHRGLVNSILEDHASEVTSKIEVKESEKLSVQSEAGKQAEKS